MGVARWRLSDRYQAIHLVNCSSLDAASAWRSSARESRGGMNVSSGSCRNSCAHPMSRFLASFSSCGGRFLATSLMPSLRKSSAGVWAGREPSMLLGWYQSPTSIW